MITHRAYPSKRASLDGRGAAQTKHPIGSSRSFAAEE